MTYLEEITTFNNYLLDKMPEVKCQRKSFKNTVEDQLRFMRGLMNISSPMKLDSKMEDLQNTILQKQLEIKKIVTISDMEKKGNNIYLYQGDITRIKADAIVNAANTKMLGCFLPLHNCIDNQIHSSAGLQLRWECNELMKKQGHDEVTGSAKITESYNLPCKNVIHTVGPIVPRELSERHCELLESCYKSCLNLAVKNHLKSIAFCCISTGVFAFPGKEAAEIAVKTVKNFQKSHDIIVIFNVYLDKDKDIYDQLLKN